MSQVELKGWNELDKELQKLPLKIQQKVMRKVVRAGASVVTREAKRLAPKRTKGWGSVVKGKHAHPPGDLKKGIVTRRKKEGNKDLITFSSTLNKKAWYGMWVEFGHKLVRNGKTIGHVAARPFLRPAFDNSKHRIIARMKAIFLKEMGKYRRG